jgi:hypothetical protein
MATAITSAAINSPLPSTLAVTAQANLLAACPCLNVKLHLATAPEETSSLKGKELKLGLAGVSVVRHCFRQSGAALPFLPCFFVLNQALPRSELC